MELSQKKFEKLFIIKERLGEGTFGCVSTAICRSNGMKYAVKQIQLPRDLNHLQKALKEKDVMQKLGHKNVIKCNYVAITKSNGNG